VEVDPVLTRLPAKELGLRYAKADLAVFTPDETRRFLTGEDPDPRTDKALAWELLYRLEPDIYDRLSRAETLHQSVVGWLPEHVDRILEVGAGTGRLTTQLVPRCDHLIAVEPAAPLRDLLTARLDLVAGGARTETICGFFDSLPVPDGWANLVVTCSALTPDSAHGGDAGLAEMEHACQPGGTVVVVWPNHLPWLREHGYRYVSFPGSISMEFSSTDEAVELAEIFYPAAAPLIRRAALRRVPYELLGVNPPRDIAYKVLSA
jgi:SAM-dependent methyltransferase